MAFIESKARFVEPLHRQQSSIQSNFSVHANLQKGKPVLRSPCLYFCNPWRKSSIESTETNAVIAAAASTAGIEGSSGF